LPDQKCKKYDYCDTTDGAEDGTTTTSTESVADVGIETGDCTSSQWHPDMTVSFMLLLLLIVNTSAYINYF
jgi:hypothetical protein